MRVTLVDRRNHHVFQPLLYQVATAGLSAPDIAAPIRRILRRQANVTRPAGRGARDRRRRAHACSLTDGELAYDYLILATGATHSYFGHDEWAPHAPGLKTLEDALEIRRRMLLAFEAAERETDAAGAARLLTFVVVGGGPTGVELAGALAEIARHTLRDEFRRIDPAEARVVLLEGATACCRRTRPTSRRRRSASSRRLGVEVRTGARVTGVDADGVDGSATERLAARTVLWAAGVAASPLGRSLGAPLDRAGRVHRRARPDACPATPRCSWSATWRRSSRTAGRCRASRPPRSRWAATPARNVLRAGAQASRRGRSATSTRARWRRSGAGPRWR